MNKRSFFGELMKQYLGENHVWPLLIALFLSKKKGMAVWKELSTEEIHSRIFSILEKNINYRERSVLGVPASHLDERVFNVDASFLTDSPFLSALVHNPNNIGCHTLGESEAFFAGTQEIERELIRIIAEDILHGEELQQDGYVASGGTEANLQAIWVYRNFFMHDKHFNQNEIALICSSDTHYSVYKAANLMNLKIVLIDVDPTTREIREEHLKQSVFDLEQEDFKAAIVVSNMMTTMFGNVDDVDLYDQVLKASSLQHFIHADGAYGGFVYPFVSAKESYTFKNPCITSFSIDAHKVLQAPFGTGIFVIRKGWMDKVENSKAEYVNGLDNTLVGSRSGANAVSVWMILQTYGPQGWKLKIEDLIKRSDYLCEHLDRLSVSYFRVPYSNIVTINASDVPQAVVEHFGLVPDNHRGKSSWVKIVIMEHVKRENLQAFIHALEESTFSMDI